jgi:hypothetical protein
LPSLQAVEARSGPENLCPRIAAEVRLCGNIASR